MARGDNARLINALTRHDVALERFSVGERLRVVRLLQDLERELLRLLTRADLDPTRPVRTFFQRQRLEALLEEAQAILREHYRTIATSHERELTAVASQEVASVAQLTQRTTSVEFATTGLTTAKLRVLVRDTPITGGPLAAAPVRAWWDQQALTTQHLFANTLRQGLLRNETLEQLIRRIRGTRARQFQDGAMQIARRHAETLVRTAALGVANATRQELFLENADLVRGVAAVVTLDARTSSICIARSGAAWSLATGRPLAGSTRQEPFPGPPPWHFRCRTSLAPLLLSDRDLPRQRLYEEWLQDQSVSVQREVLGAGRYALWRQGRLPLSALISQDGRPLTLAQLQQAS